MCGFCANATLPPDTAALEFELRAEEWRMAKRTVSRRKKRAIEKPSTELARELRRIWRRERARVLDLLGTAELPYTTRPAREHSFTGYEELYRYLLNGVDYAPYNAALVETYRDISPAAMDDILRQVAYGLGIGRGAELLDFPAAQKWIHDHAIQFGAQWADKVTATTNLAIRETLAKGWANFESTQQLMGRVQKVYDVATDTRAEMIARTESNRAYSSATVEMGRELGAQQKFWIISGSPYSYVDVCADNAALETIPMSQSFRDIDGMPIDGPPAHPNCLCDIGYEFPDNWELPEKFVTGGFNA